MSADKTTSSESLPVGDLTLDVQHFEELYSASEDPWNVRSGWYELRKRACLLATLPDRGFARGFEPGCGIGVLSRDLAERCDELVCWEGSRRATDTARTALADIPHVTMECAEVPSNWPTGTFDLIVLSELVYYLNAEDRATFWTATLDSLRPGGVIAAVHWVHPSREHRVDGHEVHRELSRRSGLERLVDHREADFRLDIYRRGNR